MMFIGTLVFLCRVSLVFILILSPQGSCLGNSDLVFHGKKERLFGRTAIYVLVPCILLAALVYYYFFYPTYELHYVVQFEDELKKACENPKLPMLEYHGVQSFFKYLANPDTDYCYSYIEFGGEKIAIPTQSERECADEVRKTKYICFNEEYEMTKDPCLVYSFGKDADSQFERDMHMFSCEVHAFDHKEVKEAEHISRTEFWKEHSWDIGEYPYDLPADSGGGIIQRRSLDYIATVLNHKGKHIKFIKSDLEGREWVLLKQIITHRNLMDISQIAVRLHLPLSVNSMTGASRHEYFGKLFQVFQGLNCAGYRYILMRPIEYYKGKIRIPEINATYYIAYELNWAK